MDIIEKFNLTDNIKALFLLYLAICAGFLANTMNCSIHKIMKNNIFVKHIVVFVLVYFTINFASGKNLSPIAIFRNTLVIYSLYILLSKQNYKFFLFNSLLIFIIYLIIIQKDYEKENNDLKNQEKYILFIKRLQQILMIFLIVGFIIYFRKQYSDHSNNFSYITFLFGNIKCNSM
jgi:hypothetical protein